MNVHFFKDPEKHQISFAAEAVAVAMRFASAIEGIEQDIDLPEVIRTMRRELWALDRDPLYKTTESGMLAASRMKRILAIAECMSDLVALKNGTTPRPLWMPGYSPDPEATPAPWGIDDDTPTMIIKGRNNDTATEIIAQVHGEANARLIVTAPEMRVLVRDIAQAPDSIDLRMMRAVAEAILVRQRKRITPL